MSFSGWIQVPKPECQNGKKVNAKNSIASADDQTPKVLPMKKAGFTNRVNE